MVLLYVVLPQYLVYKFSPQSAGSIARQISQFIFNPLPTPTPSPTPTPTPTPGLTPVTIIIPKLNIQTAIEQVGLTPDNYMDVPKNANNAGWYMYGTKPSEAGNAVITGHYDTPTGAPALFYYLKRLEIGDEVTTVSENAIKSIFTVTGKETIPYDKFPKDYVFVTKVGKNLNLITCDGVWNQQKRVYSDRIVVYTTLKEVIN